MGELTIKAGWLNQQQGAMEGIKSAQEAADQKEKKSYFAGDLTLAKDSIAEKRREAQKKAWNLVDSAWKNDQSIDDMIRSRENHAEEMGKWKEESVEQLSQISAEEKTLQEQYAVAPDSQEQQDLELLKKRQDFENGVTHDMPTKEERERLAELDKQPLTEYQERALTLNERAGRYKRDIEKADMQMKDDTADIRSIQQERLKSNPMLDAQKQAEEIYKSANEQIVGMAVQEAKDHLDEVQEEAEEKAEETAEKQEVREEKLEEIKEIRKLQEAFIEGTREAVEEAESEQRKNDAPEVDMEAMLDMTKSNQKSQDVKSGLDEIKYSMKLLEADLKGIKVDQEV